MATCKYDPKIHGIVTTIRLFEDGNTPMATLTFSNGETATIEWAKREEYAAGINSSTLICGLLDVTFSAFF